MSTKVIAILILAFISVATIGGLVVVKLESDQIARRNTHNTTEVIYGHRTGTDGQSYLLTDTGWRNENS